MHGMRRILEDSDFIKQIIVNQKLSQNFYNYNLSMQRDQSALLPLLFSALENPKCCEDAFKSLIVTIKFQDTKLINNWRAE